MRILDYPRPAADTGIGFHYFPDLSHYSPDDFALWMPILKGMGASWLTLLVPFDRPIPEDFVKGLQDGGIEPIIRIYTPAITAIDQTQLRQLAQTYAAWGAHYLYVYDEPNMSASWPEFSLEALPDRFMDLYLPCLETLSSVDGIIPVFTPLAPGGDYWDTEFLRTCFDWLSLRGRTDLFERLAVGMHNSAGNKPLTWGEGGPPRWPNAKPYDTPAGSQDQTGFRLFEWYNAIIQPRVGRSLPLIACANGARFDARDISEFPVIDEPLHAMRHAEMSAALINNQVPDYAFNNAFWLLCADERSPFLSDRWYYLDGSERLWQSIHALQLMHKPRARVPVIELPTTIRVLMSDDVTVREIDFEEYLKGVVPVELPSNAPYEALKAQAVAARCFAARARRHFDKVADVCTTSHCQAWQEQRFPQTDRAVEDTRGLVAVFNGEIIDAYYHAQCDGQMTRSSERALDSLDGYQTCFEHGWEVLPYCRAVACTGHAPYHNALGFFGHGVGMCKTGAMEMAARGAGFVEVITHYYTGVQLVKTIPVPSTVPVPQPQPPSPAPQPAPVQPPAPQPQVPNAPTPVDGDVSGRWRMDIRRLRGARAIAGSFPRAAIDLTIIDAYGHSVTFKSGNKPEYGPGGFEVPVWTNGTYAIQFEKETFYAVVEDDFLSLTFTETQQPDVAEYQIVSTLMDAQLAEQWLEHFDADPTYVHLFKVQNLSAGRVNGTHWSMNIERRAGVRALAGTLPRAGIAMRVSDAFGHAVDVVSGSKPEFGVGGFEVLCWTDGLFTLSFLGQNFGVEVGGSFTQVSFVELQGGSARLVSGWMTRDEAERWLEHLQSVPSYRDIFGIEKRE